jgi:hypothetical protein
MTFILSIIIVLYDVWMLQNLKSFDFLHYLLDNVGLLDGNWFELLARTYPITSIDSSIGSFAELFASVENKFSISLVLLEVHKFHSEKSLFLNNRAYMIDSSNYPISGRYVML